MDLSSPMKHSYRITRFSKVGMVASYCTAAMYAVTSTDRHRCLVQARMSVLENAAMRQIRRTEGLERAGTGHPVGRAEACKVKICVPHRRKSGLSPLCRFSATQLTSAIVVEAKRFNDHLGFAQSLWKV